MLPQRVFFDFYNQQFHFEGSFRGIPCSNPAQPPARARTGAESAAAPAGPAAAAAPDLGDFFFTSPTTAISPAAAAPTATATAAAAIPCVPAPTTTAGGATAISPIAAAAATCPDIHSCPTPLTSDHPRQLQAGPTSTPRVPSADFAVADTPQPTTQTTPERLDSATASISLCDRAAARTLDSESSQSAARGGVSPATSAAAAPLDQLLSPEEEAAYANLDQLLASDAGVFPFPDGPLGPPPAPAQQPGDTADSAAAYRSSQAAASTPHSTGHAASDSSGDLGCDYYRRQKAQILAPFTPAVGQRTDAASAGH